MGEQWDTEVGVTCVLTTDQHGSRPGLQSQGPSYSSFLPRGQGPLFCGWVLPGVRLGEQSGEPGLEGGQA